MTSKQTGGSLLPFTFSHILKLKLLTSKRLLKWFLFCSYQYWRGSSSTQKEERYENRGWSIFSTKQISLGLLLCDPLSSYSTCERALNWSPLLVFLCLWPDLCSLPLSGPATVLLGHINRLPCEPSWHQQTKIWRQTRDFGNISTATPHPHPCL